MSVNHAAIAERMQEVKTELAERSAQDSTFRSSLMSDPNTTIENEYGLEAGTFANVKMNVVVEEPGSIVIPIPPDMSEVELTDEQLDQVAGGAAFIAAVTAVTAAGIAAGTFVARETRTGRRW